MWWVFNYLQACQRNRVMQDYNDTHTQKNDKNIFHLEWMIFFHEISILFACFLSFYLLKLINNWHCLKSFFKIKTLRSLRWPSSVACENSRPSALPARVAFREKDVCDLPPKIPYWWSKSVPHLVMSADWFDQ